VVVFPDVFRNVRFMLREEEFVLLEGKMELRQQRIQMLVSTIIPFDETKVPLQHPERLFIKISNQDNEQALKKINEIAQQHTGKTSIIIYTVETGKTYQLADNYQINPTQDCLRVFQSYFGEENIALEKHK